MRGLWLVLLLVLLLLVPLPVAAQDFEAAAKHFQLAQQAFSQKHFRRAATEFEATFEITKDPLLHYNIAEAWQACGEGKKAAAAYAAYLTANPSSQDRGDVQKRIRALEVAQFVVPDKSAPESEPAAATTPTAPASSVAALATQPAVAPPAPSVAPAPPPPPVANLPSDNKPAPGLFDEAPPSKLRTAAWIGVAASVVTLTAGTIFGLTAKARGDDVSRALSYVSPEGLPATFNSAAQADYQSRVNDGRLYDQLSISFLTIGGAVAATTVVLFALDLKRKPAKRDRAWIEPQVAPGQAMLRAGWTF